jgi:hypothetical protein
VGFAAGDKNSQISITQFDPGYPWFLRGPRTKAKLVPKTHDPHAALPETNYKIFAIKHPCNLHQNFVIMLPSKHKTQPSCSVSFLWCIMPTIHFPPYLLHFPKLYLTTILPLLEGRSGTVWVPSEQQITPPLIINVAPIAKFINIIIIQHS